MQTRRRCAQDAPTPSPSPVRVGPPDALPRSFCAGGGFDQIESAIRLKGLLPFAVAAMFAALGFELRAPLFELRLLFGRQDREHLLVLVELCAHQLRLNRSRFGQLLRRKGFVERAAFACLAQLLVLGPKLRAQRFGLFREALANLLQLRLLFVRQVEVSEHTAAEMIAALSGLVTTLTPTAVRALLVAMIAALRLREGERGG